MNIICLTGRLVRDPEQRYLPNGSLVARFTIAVDRQHKNEDGSKQTDFIRCSAFGKTAEFITNYLHKSRLIAVEGSLHINSVAQADGTNRTYAEVTANSVQALDYDKPDEPHQPEEQDNHAHPILEFDNDVPFAN